MKERRVAPTINKTAFMNRQELRSWEIRLGLIQMVVLLGVVTGSMACAFYLGFFSGRDVGFESALENSLASTARFSIEPDGSDITDDAVPTSEVYSKLTNSAVTEPTRAEEASPILGSIRAGSLAELSDDNAAAKSSQSRGLDPAAAGADSSQLNSLSANSLYPNGSESKSANAPIGAKEGSETGIKLGALAKVEKPSLASANQPNSEATSLIAESNVSPGRKPLTESPKAQSTKDKISTSEFAALKNPEIGKSESKKSVLEPESSVKPVKSPPLPKGGDISRGFYVQVAAPKRLQDATALTEKLRASGFKVSIENARVRGEEYFRIMVGPESSRGLADRLLAQVKRESYIQSDPFVRAIR